MYNLFSNITRTLLRLFFSVLFGVCFLSGVSAFELTTTFHMGNLLFDTDAESTVPEFAGDSFPKGLSIMGKQELDEYAHISMGLIWDPILRYSAYTLFEYNHDYFTIGVGPFFGVLNHIKEPLNPGVSTSVRVVFPGVVFGALRTDSTIGSRLVSQGQYIQQKNHMSVGYYIPNAVCSINLDTSEFVLQQSSTRQTEDLLTKYTFLVEMFQENVDLQLDISLGYQTLIRRYIDSSGVGTTPAITENKLNSLMLGTGFTYSVTEKLGLLFDLEGAVYSFGKAGDNNLKFSSDFPGTFLFRGSLGASYIF